MRHRRVHRAAVALEETLTRHLRCRIPSRSVAVGLRLHPFAEESMRVCPHCQYEVQADTAAFCPACGKGLDGASSPAPPPPVQAVKVIGLEIPFSDVFVLTLKWMMACILIGVVLGLVYYAYHAMTYNPADEAIRRMQEEIAR